MTLSSAEQLKASHQLGGSLCCFVRCELELNQGASLSGIAAPRGSPSLALLPSHSMPGSFHKQCPPAAGPWLLGEAGQPGRGGC